MSGHFTLTIRLGNEAMSTGEHVADALHKVAEDVEMFSDETMTADGIVRDLNGNTVGRWEMYP